ncbi:alpha/beta hydrolase [Phenylobacterium sp.]|uniref:alpha/beta hydrolase n=1 Tax=Phenylobacterium sp. TaxID=1871053 RepID=UPI002F4187B0
MAEWRNPEIAAMAALMASYAPPPGAPEPSWAERRMGFDAMGAAAPVPEGVTVSPITLGGVPAEQITPAGADPTRTIFYLHGGGYCLGGMDSHRTMVAKMALAAGATAFNVDYRLAPEHPFPAAVDDAVAAWRAFLAMGRDPGRTVIAGDSAGGGLSVACSVAARDAGLPLAAGLHLISPWANMQNASPAYRAKADTDFLVTQQGIDDFKGAYLGQGDPKTPLASPVFANLAGLPPILIQVGSEEMLMSDSTQLAEAAGLARVDVTLRIWPDMVHIWPFFAHLSAGGPAIAESSAWIRARVA